MKQPVDLIRRLYGIAVHLLTASGVVFALLALNAAVDQRFAEMFGWLGVALCIDGVDGPLARLVDIEKAVPFIDGAVLDLIVDYLTYVLIPLVGLSRSGLLAPGLSLPITVGAAAASSLYFADRRMKTADHWFRGFPALWNVACLYLFEFRPPPALTAGIIIALAMLMFAPVVFVHPMRVRALRPLTIVVTAVWLAAAIGAVVTRFEGGSLTDGGLVLSGLYFVVLPFLRRTSSPSATDPPSRR